ncbi:MAG: SPOR domain-containing protein [Brevundimonas sp.]|uniref:SPOR domain-containing protein n=1 Tax=Brevundimonas sp. TaxID=1871086 RepID=UPI002584D8EC|nr:SPOR domain-containing protein [Brevundimonas sp.]MCV0415847.1 SPOR domain-containing protein [Brevundimonas sp.]
MSFDDDNRPGRGAYTPPTDDDLPFRRNSFDPRDGGRRVGGGGGRTPPVTLIVSAAVLLLLIVAVIFFYRSGLRASTDAPPAVGQPVGEMKSAPPIDAQPVDPAEGVRVYRDEATETTDAPITFTPPPEAPQPRPAAPPASAPTGQGLAPAAPAASATPAPRPAPPAASTPAAPAPAPTPAAAGGSASVQIGAFSSTEIADREYAAVAGRFGQYASGAQKRVTEVTTSSGSTLYRTAFAGLSRERATAFCNALKAAGRDCIVR